jgi:hypothetical protein
LDGANKMRPMALCQSSAPVKCQWHRKHAMTVKANRLLNDSSINSVASFINANLLLFDHASPWGAFFQCSNSCLVVGWVKMKAIMPVRIRATKHWVRTGTVTYLSQHREGDTIKSQKWNGDCWR